MLAAQTSVVGTRVAIYFDWRIGCEEPLMRNAIIQGDIAFGYYRLLVPIHRDQADNGFVMHIH